MHYLCNIMTYESLWRQLTAIYDSGEAKAIIRYVLDVRFGMSATDIYCGKVTQLSADDCAELQKIAGRLQNAEPVQYVLGHADFCGRTFTVAPGVLIPRPETEELCEWVIADSALSGAVEHILDIGTGSGCIAITLAHDVCGASVSGWDVSEAALAIARGNASALNADVCFVHQDALQPPHDTCLWDVIVSNPPYICNRERRDMERNVLEHEPHTALFVPDDDPLMFYRAIARYAAEALRPGGMLYFEINPLFAADMTAMMQRCGFVSVETRCDSFGKVRFVKGSRTA